MTTLSAGSVVDAIFSPPNINRGFCCNRRRQACLSEFHFHRLFRTTLGETPHDFLTRLRMDRAKQMMAAQRTVTEVCFEVGYGSLGSFSSKFRSQFGRSPAEFQREVRRIFGYSAPWRVLMLPGCFLRAWTGVE
jgi:hypothetical protein